MDKSEEKTKSKQVAIAIQKEKPIKLKPVTELEEEVVDLNLTVTPAD